QGSGGRGECRAGGDGRGSGGGRGRGRTAGAERAVVPRCAPPDQNSRGHSLRRGGQDLSDEQTAVRFDARQLGNAQNDASHLVFVGRVQHVGQPQFSTKAAIQHAHRKRADPAKNGLGGNGG